MSNLSRIHLSQSEAMAKRLKVNKGFLQPKLQDSYEISEIIGAGNFGEVHLAQHVTSKEVVAVKTAPHAEKEAAILMTLSHPNVLKCVACFKKIGRLGPYMVVELLHSAADLEVRQTIAGIALGVAFLHSRDVVHRDLKPDNIMMSKSRCPKLVDFGQAARLRQSLWPGWRLCLQCS